jgi:hypothetical protein
MTDDKRKEIVDWAMADFAALIDLIEVASVKPVTLEGVKRYLREAGVPVLVIQRAADEVELKQIRRAS